MVSSDRDREPLPIMLLIDFQKKEFFLKKKIDYCTHCPLSLLYASVLFSPLIFISISLSLQAPQVAQQ